MAGREVAALLETRFREGTVGQDAVHWGRGGVRAYRSDDGDVLIELQSDFEVGPGPNFWVDLNSRGGIDDEADFEGDAGRQRIARLKSFTGVTGLPGRGARVRSRRRRHHLVRELRAVHRVRGPVMADPRRGGGYSADWGPARMTPPIGKPRHSSRDAIPALTRAALRSSHHQAST